MSSCNHSSMQFSETFSQFGAHDHLCLIYENWAEQCAAVVPLLQVGLARGEKCLYVADETSIDAVLRAMRGRGIDTESAIASRALGLLRRPQAHLKQGFLDPGRILDFLTAAADSAEDSTFTAFRIIGEMALILGDDPDAERLIEYEARLHSLLEEHDITAICQYDRYRFEPRILVDAIRTHPTVVHGGIACRNPYYTPPEELFTPKQPEFELARFLNNIRERRLSEERLKERARREASVARVAQLALKNTDPSLPMDKAVALLRESLNLDVCGVLELLPAGNTMLLTAGLGWKEGRVGSATLETGRKSFAGYTLLSSGMVMSEDLRSDGRFKVPVIFSEVGAVSAMSFVIAGKKPLGILCALTTRRRVFNGDDMQFLQSVAPLLAESIERRRRGAVVNPRKVNAPGQAENELKRLAAILGATTDWVAFADPEGRIRYLNQAGRKLIQIDADEDVSGTPIADYHPEWATKLIMEEGIPEAMRSGIWTGETELLTRSGRAIGVSQVILAHKAHDGTVEYFSIIIREATEQELELAAGNMVGWMQ